MPSRRQFLRLSLATLLTTAAGSTLVYGQEPPPPQVWIPLVNNDRPPEPLPEPTPEPIIGEGPLLGPPSGNIEQAVHWFAPRAAVYTPYDIGVIVGAYQRWGDAAGVDWFLALAQCAHETGHLTSFWSQRPQRNPAGLGVTGQSQLDPPADTHNWAYNTQRERWEVGISFPTWADHAVPAHLGRLLAYALRDDQANETQRDLIAFALAYRPLPDSLRGVAPTIVDLNGRWAVPGTEYGQRILGLVQRMRAG